jgi:hypothetical protein
MFHWLTDGAISGVTAPAARRVFQLPSGGRGFSCQLAGLDFSTERRNPQSVFESRGAFGDTRVVMSADGHPVFLRSKRGACDVFLQVGSEIPDVDDSLQPQEGIQEHYDQIIPLFVFFRHCFGMSCWHGPGSTARFIIDDPLLASTYGFLKYGDLLKSMRSLSYGTTIAFIPWYYWRTRKRSAADLFSDNSNLSICIHGCDHTKREFDTMDARALEWKTGLALQRMERHRERTALPYDAVMTFPQGKFSTSAMLALRASRYMAAVNSTCFPSDYGDHRLTIGDMLRPAITSFHGFPIFSRHYPKRLIDSAFDLFLGRPALIVEHHDYFRGGLKHLEEFVTGLCRSEPVLSWPSLSTQLSRSCMMKHVGIDAVEVRFFTGRFYLKNSAPCRKRFLLTKYEPDGALVRTALVDGVQAPFSFHDDYFQLEVEADAGQEVVIEVLDHPRVPIRTFKGFGLRYRFGVLLRRSLSEFRDATLAKHPRLLRFATVLMRLLNVTGE